MAEALRHGHANLLRTIEQALATIDHDVTADLNGLDSKWQAKYDALKDASEKTRTTLETKVETLVSQVSKLQAELDQRKAAEQAVKDQPTDSPSESVAELRQSLEKARERYAAVKGHLDTVVTVARTRKEQIVGWVKYADSLELKIQKLERKRSRHSAAGSILPMTSSGTRGTTPHIPATPVTLEKPRPLQVQAEVEKPTLSASFSSSASSFLGITAPSDDDDNDNDNAVAKDGTAGGSGDKDVELPNLPPQVFAAADDDRQHNEAAIASTQGEPSSDGSQPDLPTPRAAATHSTQVRVKEEPSSDSPEVVWERPAKRSRTDEGSRAPHVPIASQVPKRERGSSGNGMLSSTVHFRESQESVDLDEGQLTVPTPRKRQLFLERMASERESDMSASESQSQEVTGAPAPGPALQTPQPSAPLAPVSSNVRRGAKDPVTVLNSMKRGIESLAADGEGYRTPDGSARRTGPRKSSGAATGLNALLDASSAGPSPVTSASRRRFDSPLTNTFSVPPPPRILPPMRGTNNTSPQLRSNAAMAAPAPVRPGGGAATTTPTASSLKALIDAKAESAKRKPAARLRGKPMDQLKMDDFKINPASNHGDTFAYNEVVRDRTDRANLAGCTDPQCCGKVFRGMAVSELDAAGPTHVSRPEGIALMERHLGDEAFRLSVMEPSKKKELWIEARTKELADKYGKHRHRYHRRASPPGFWDTDFPTTQEEEYNRAEAEKVEQITVQERYREAMRPGGRWLFRDE